MQSVNNLTHGGARSGAGRPKKADKRKLIGFFFDPATITLLHKALPTYARSRFVERLVIDALTQS